MVNYDDLPLFPLHVVLYPDMPLPLHIFEPRYREMVARCRFEHAPFGIVLIRTGEEFEEEAEPFLVGTTARITQCETLPDGRLNIVVVGETRFRIKHLDRTKSYLSAAVSPFSERGADPSDLRGPHLTVVELFRHYLKNLFAVTNRPLSALQLPQEPEYLSYAVASVLQIPLLEKQQLLEMTSTQVRLDREIVLLKQEIELQTRSHKSERSCDVSGQPVIVPVHSYELSKLSSRN